MELKDVKNEEKDNHVARSTNIPQSRIKEKPRNTKLFSVLQTVHVNKWQREAIFVTITKMIATNPDRNYFYFND